MFDDRLAIPDVEFDKAERLRAEKEMLGLYVSDHPLMGVEPALRRLVECSIAELARARRRRDAHGRGRRHRVSSASTRSAATSWPRSCSKTSRAAIEVMVFPKTMLHVRRAARADAIVDGARAASTVATTRRS